MPGAVMVYSQRVVSGTVIIFSQNYHVWCRYGLQTTLSCLVKLGLVSGAVMLWFTVKTVKAGAVIVYIQHCHALCSYGLQATMSGLVGV